MNFLFLRLRSLLAGLMVITVLSLISGCGYLVIGGVGALGGYVVSPDTVEGITENDVDTIFAAAVEIVSIMGLIQESDETAGVILAKVSGAKVTIQIIELSPSTSKVSIKARKSMLPKISVAQDVYVKIMKDVNE